MLTPYYEWAFEKTNCEKVLNGHYAHGISEIKQLHAGILAAGALFSYIKDTQKNSLIHFKAINSLERASHILFDTFTLRNLELTSSLREHSRKGTLLGVLDKTATPVGARLIKQVIEKPLRDKKQIEARHDAVSELKANFSLRKDLLEKLSKVTDLERLLAKIAYGSLDARGALSILASLNCLPDIKRLLSNTKSSLLFRIFGGINELPELTKLLKEAIDDVPPQGISDGGIIRPGFNAEVDKLREASCSAKSWIAKLEARERQNTGIKNLKVGYNRVFGYYIEITNSQREQVPYEYQRKQTLVNCERYITPELKEYEQSVLGADEKCAKLEEELFIAVRLRIAEKIEILQQNARYIATLDVLNSFAQVAYDNNYVRPSMSNSCDIKVKGGRHPVVECAAKIEFTPNDCEMKNGELLLITGPNMGGKSTYMRQLALIVIMAQMGSFVPASSAEIGIVDRVFTRVGASDDIAAGLSTFMVEMRELADILTSATSNSLLILDEIGRGTSTADGLCLAWATIEHIVSKIKAKTLFATHFHELTELEGTLPGVLNFSVTVREYGEDILFLHKIKRGGADRSFGIEVAKLAGLPAELLVRAKALLGSVSIDAAFSGEVNKTEGDDRAQKLAAEIARLEVERITPMEALSILDGLKRKAEQL